MNIDDHWLFPFPKEGLPPNFGILNDGESREVLVNYNPSGSDELCDVYRTVEEARRAAWEWWLSQRTD